jgi:hypothetical protein
MKDKGDSGKCAKYQQCFTHWWNYLSVTAELCTAKSQDNTLQE